MRLPFTKSNRRRPTAPGGKVTKRSVRYHKAWLVENLLERNCGHCSMFRASTSSCTDVAGHIRLLDVCDRFDREK